MNKLLALIAFSVLLLVPIGVQNAFATVIDFDTFPDGTVPDDRTRLTNQYAECGVSLFTTNDAAGPEIQLNSASNSPPNLLTPAGLRFLSTGSIGIEFSSPLSGDFSVFAIQIKGGGLSLQAFDSANNPVGAPYDIPPNSNDRFETMTVRGDDIVKLVVSQIVPQTGGFVDGYFIDDLEFPGPVCEFDDSDSDDEGLLLEILSEIKDIWMAIQNEVIPLLQGIDTKLDSTETKVSVTVNLGDIKLKTDEVMVLLDTTDSGKLSTVHVAANLPCNIMGDGKPTDGDLNDDPGIWVVAGVAGGSLSGVINDSDEDTGFVGPEKTCVFHGTVTAADLGHDITDVIIVHPDNHAPMGEEIDDTKKHEKLKGVVVTITGTYE